ncbi:MAG: hypothetical protein V5804_08870 [Mucilaginibacter sp.]|uniref:hypothetical protein n=1 Tax=Mucilaginibacter sp. TaxID=1882438 RepID=UPI0034E53819
MKTFKITSIILSLFFLLGNAKADKPKHHTVFTMHFSVNAFIDADARGLCDGLTDIIADNAKFSIMRGDQMLCFNKKEIIKSMESLRGVQQNCTTNYKVVETFDRYVLVKVEMKYPTFSRFNYITLHQCSDGWKITNVSSIFVK